MCVNTLVGIARNSQCAPAARTAAASYLLDRGWGKAPTTFADGEHDIRVIVRHIIQGRDIVDMPSHSVTLALPNGGDHD